MPIIYGNTTIEGNLVTNGITASQLKLTDGASNGYILQSDANGNATWVAPSGAGVTGSGTTNYVPKWSGVSTLTSTSSIYDDGSSVGIGTNTPTSFAKLHINNSDTASSTYGNYITVNGSNSSKVGQYILLSNTTSTEQGIIIGFSAGTQRKVGVDVGGGLGVSNSDVGYQYNSSSTQTNNYGGYFRITATSSQNTILYGEITGGINSTHHILRGSISGSSYNTTYGFRHTDTSTSTIKYGQNILLSGNGLSTTNYGSLINISGANGLQYGVDISLSGTFSSGNQGVRVSLSAGSGAGTNQGIFSSVFGSGERSYGLWSQARNGSVMNVGVWGIVGSNTATTSADIGGRFWVNSDATLPTSYGITVNNSSSSPSGTTKIGAQITVSGNTEPSSLNGVQVLVTANAASSNIGINNQVSGTGSNIYGLYNNTNGNSVSNQIFGVRNDITSAISSYGLYNQILGSVGTSKYGVYTNIQGTGSCYGEYIIITATGSNNYGLQINVSGANNNNYAIQTLSGDAIFNDNGLNYDFRVEGDTDQNLFFVDASTDSIGIGNNTPSYKLQVSGTVSSTTGFNTNGLNGWSGTFSADGQLVTVTGGIITSVV
jgi:hypothetical protein